MKPEKFINIILITLLISYEHEEQVDIKESVNISIK